MQTVGGLGDRAAEPLAQALHDGAELLPGRVGRDRLLADLRVQGLKLLAVDVKRRLGRVADDYLRRGYIQTTDQYGHNHSHDTHERSYVNLH